MSLRKTGSSTPKGDCLKNFKTVSHSMEISLPIKSAPTKVTIIFSLVVKNCPFPEDTHKLNIQKIKNITAETANTRINASILIMNISENPRDSNHQKFVISWGNTSNTNRTRNIPAAM